MDLNVFIAILTVVFSGITSWSVATLTLRNERNKINKDFSIVLLNKRLDCYPKLWSLATDVYGVKKISGLNKKGKGELAVSKNRDEIRSKLKEWRKENGIYLSKSIHNICFKSINGGAKQSLEISSLKAFQALEESLFLKEKCSEYSMDKAYKIDKDRNILILSLHMDIGVMEKSDIYLKKSI